MHTSGTPFRAWQLAMQSLGYTCQFVYLNSMHAQLFGPGAPQSRDRFYAVCTRADAPTPDVSRVVSPAAVCPECGPVRAVQSWKRLDRRAGGKYRSQYVYRCPNISCRNQIVEPTFRSAAEIIDWSLRGSRIGDRDRPLADKTMARIRTSTIVDSRSALVNVPWVSKPGWIVRSSIASSGACVARRWWCWRN